jgi:endonuclease/exonuclease/phosphatase family metal-dependent hydrolase
VLQLAQKRVRIRTQLKQQVPRLFAASAWLYFLFVVLVWILLRTAGDRWWFATVLLYGPRWPYGLPLVVLFPFAAWRYRRSLWPLTVAAAIFLFPIMGFRVPLARSSAADKPKLRVLTCNMQGGQVARNALATLLRAEQADIVALQESDVDLGDFWPDGWQVLKEGGLVVASRFPLRDVSHSLRVHPQSNWPPVNALRCVVMAPFADVGFCCVHLLTPRGGLERVLDKGTIVAPRRSRALRELIEYRRWESEELKAWIDAGGLPTIIAGDFNMPVDSVLYRDIWSSFTNAFDAAGVGIGYTKRTSARGWQFGARIDQILFNKQSFGCRNCWVAPDVGSDHLPLMADIIVIDCPLAQKQDIR